MSPYHAIMNERDAALRDFDRRIAELQASCPHKELTGWLQGYDCFARLCKRCYATVERRNDPDRPPAVRYLVEGFPA
jgi:hypothetical protein